MAELIRAEYNDKSQLLNGSSDYGHTVTLRFCHLSALKSSEKQEIFRHAIKSGFRSFEFASGDMNLVKSLLDSESVSSVPGLNLFITLILEDLLHGESGTTDSLKYEMESLIASDHNVTQGLVIGLNTADYQLVEKASGFLKGLKENGLIHLSGLKGILSGDYLRSKELSIDMIGSAGRYNACNMEASVNEAFLSEKLGISFCNWEPLHWGLLGERLEQYSRAGEEEGKVTGDDIITAVMASRLAAEAGMTIGEMAARFALSLKNVKRTVFSVNSTDDIGKLEQWLCKGIVDRLLFNKIIDNIFMYNN